MFQESSVAQVAGTFFSNIWNLLLSVEVPGLDAPFAAFLVAVFLIRFSIRIFSYLTGFGLGFGDYGRVGTMAEKLKNDSVKTMPGDHS